MTRSLAAGCLSASLAMVAVALPARDAAAEDRPSASATTRVVIRVEPTAEATFTNGSEFVLEVPPSRGQAIVPALLSFDVRTNAPVELRLGPSEVVAVHDGRLLGAAAGTGDRHRNRRGAGHVESPGLGHGAAAEERIGYVIGLLFPAPPLRKLPERLSRKEIEALWAQAESGDAATATVLFEPEREAQTASGLIIIASERGWTEHGDDAPPGHYAGAIQITVVVMEQL